MTKAATAEYLAGKLQVIKANCPPWLEELGALACREAKHTCTVPGLGELVLRKRKARMGRNPQTGTDQDAIHLAAALLYREQRRANLVTATHDAALAVAARTHGFLTIGGLSS